jgi:hypothetical protein
MMADGTAPRLIRIPGPLAGGVWAASAAPASFRPALTGDTTGLRLAADPNGALRLDCADGSLGRLTLPLGVAIDHDRRVYLLDAQRGLVLRHDPGAPDYDPARPFAPLAVGNHPPSDPAGDNPRRFTGATAIAVDRDSLYVADAGSGRVLVFALGSWALRDVWRFPGRERPWDVAVARAGVFVLTPHRAYLWRPGDSHPRPVVERPGGPLWYWSRLAVDRDDRLYVLTRRPDGSEAKLLVYDSRRQELLPEPVAEAAAVRDRFPPPPVFTLPDEEHGDPQYVMPEPLTQPCGREWPGPLPGRPIESYLTRAPRPEGGFVFDARGDLVQREAVRPTRTRLFRTGAKPPDDPDRDDPWISQRLDSRLFDCRWDLVELEFGDLPPGCRAELSTFTTNEELPSEQVWREPEAAWAAGLSVIGPPRAPTSDPNVTTDFLVGGPPGRYLWLRVRFRSDGFATPVLRAASVRFPRRSYLEHLPAVFSEDEAGRRFLEQFLAVFQAEWDRLESRADGLADLFDPRGVPDSHLDYLAGWLGARFENGDPRPPVPGGNPGSVGADAGRRGGGAAGGRWREARTHRLDAAAGPPRAAGRRAVHRRRGHDPRRRPVPADGRRTPARGGRRARAADGGEARRRTETRNRPHAGLTRPGRRRPAALWRRCRGRPPPVPRPRRPDRRAVLVRRPAGRPVRGAGRP